jgi:sugar diacid utilization regulator
MTALARTTTLGMVLTELGGEARLLTGSEDDLDRPVTGASVLTELDLPADAGVALICPNLTTPDDIEHLGKRLPSNSSRVLVLTAPSPVPAAELKVRLRGQIVVGTADVVDPATVIMAIARSIDVPDETVTRRLASLQRSLTQVLGEPEPLVTLLARLKSTCNATVALVDKRGKAVHSTGPVPLSLLFGEISHTTAETQMLDIDGWHGIADRVNDPAQAGDHMGWLVVTARRDGFPDSYAVSAVHVAAALVEASQRMTLVARQQERAIRASVLEEALALHRTPDDPELAGRIASLGLTFTEELRAVVVRPARSALTGRRRAPAKELADGLTRALEASGIGHLISARDKFVVMLIQASSATLRRVIVAAQDSIPPAHVGVGRPVQAVGEVTDSYHDAQLAVQSLRRAGPGPSLMTYEDFDFATRLFADVGTDRMIAWAHDFLAPLEERGPLMEGLRAFFAHSQNMNAAADALSIHHNSLRYRLAKVEELLELSLRDPAAISSLFLALSARDLERVQAGPPPRATRTARTRQPSDVEAPRIPADFATPRVERLGVVLDPGR